MEHRLFGNYSDLETQVQVARQWKAIEGEKLPDTLLGPEGSGASPLHGPRKSVSDFTILSNQLHEQPGARDVMSRPYFENYTVDASIFVAQVYKGTRWMPWHQEPKKDVGICDKPRGVDNQTVIRGFPNGETRLEASPVTRI